MSNEKVIVFIDFDHTIIDDNTDRVVKSLAGDAGIPEVIKKMKKDPNGWTAYMREIFRHLHEKNISKKDYMSCLANIPLVDGMEELLKKLVERNYEIIIVSDSNTFFIDYILQHYNLKDSIVKIFTNPAKFNKDGCLQIEQFQEKNDCLRCADNMCKGLILQNYLTQTKGYKYCIYIGDGFNDLCPVLKLSSKDIVFPRKGYSLMRSIQKMPDSDIEPDVRPWTNAYDILKSI